MDRRRRPSHPGDHADSNDGDGGEGFPVPWSPWAVLWVFVLQLSVVTLFGILLAQLVMSGVVNESDQAVLLLPASSLAAAAMTVLVVARRHPGHTWRLRGPRGLAPRQVAVGIGYGIVCYLLVGFVLASALQALVTAGGGEIPDIQQSFRDFAADPNSAPVFVFGAVLLAPIGEELMWRGMLFQSLRSRLGTWPGVGLSAVAFGLIHLDPTATTGANLLVFVLIFPLGMLFAWMFHREGSIVVPISAHCTFNAISAALLIMSIGA